MATSTQNNELNSFISLQGLSCFLDELKKWIDDHYVSKDSPEWVEFTNYLANQSEINTDQTN